MLCALRELQRGCVPSGLHRAAQGLSGIINEVADGVAVFAVLIRGVLLVIRHLRLTINERRCQLPPVQYKSKPSLSSPDRVNPIRMAFENPDPFCVAWRELTPASWLPCRSSLLELALQRPRRRS